MPQQRPISEHERKVLERLLHSGVKEREKWLRQASDFPVEMLDDDDSLIFVHPDTDTGVQGSISEADYMDSDGVEAHFSTRVVGEFLHVVDIYKDDGSRMKSPIVLDNIDVYWPAKLGEKGWWEK